jgi:hypothetical protein
MEKTTIKLKQGGIIDLRDDSDVPVRFGVPGQGWVYTSFKDLIERCHVPDAAFEIFRDYVWVRFTFLSVTTCVRRKIEVIIKFEVKGDIDSDDARDEIITTEQAIVQAINDRVYMDDVEIVSIDCGPDPS